jgi:hypothetical protein
MIRYKDGIIVPVLDVDVLDVDASFFPEEFCDEILKYFSDRNEDES